MNFTKPEKVLQTIRAGDTANFTRSENRKKITEAANGKRVLTEADASSMGLKINVNWGELAMLLSHARRQYYNAMLEGQRFFEVKLSLAPEEKCKSWESIISTEINAIMKASQEWFDIQQWRWTDVTVHGVATTLWRNQDDWMPKFVAREDLRIPTDTYTSRTNLDWFAVRTSYTIGELVNIIFGEHSLPGWNKKAVARILANYKEVNYDDAMNAIDWETQPEKLAELVKQNLGLYSSDATPIIPIYSFYFKDIDTKWYLRCVPDTPSVRGGSEAADKFLYETEEPEADTIDQLMHWQLGDLGFSTPFRLNSIRSLGFVLLEPCYYTNLTRCRLLQHIHENFNPWVQLTDPSDKARVQELDFSGPIARIPPGVKIMGRNERHQIDANLVEMGLSQLKQLMQEASASYTQQTDTGTQKEQTAFETSVKVQQVNAMLAGLLLVAFNREHFLDLEFARRFCRRNSTNNDVKDFQRRCIQQGVPPEWLDSKRWSVEHVQPLGSGNPTLQQVQANQLMQIRPMLNPTAQNEALHDALTVFADAKRADRWVPMQANKGVTSAQAQAQSDFGSLMWGSPVPIHVELNPTEQIETLLGKMAGVVTRIAQGGGETDQAELTGLQTVAQHISQLIQMLASNPEEKQRVAKYGQTLGKIMNEVKAIAQRMMEQKKKQQGNGDGKVQAELAEKMMRAGLDTKIKERTAAQSLRHKDIEFAREQRRKDATAFADIHRENAKQKLTIFNQDKE